MTLTRRVTRAVSNPSSIAQLRKKVVPCTESNLSSIAIDRRFDTARGTPFANAIHFVIIRGLCVVFVLWDMCEYVLSKIYHALFVKNG